MPLTVNERQARFRASKAGKARLDVLIEQRTLRTIRDLAMSRGVSQAGLIEQLVDEAERRDQEQMSMDEDMGDLVIDTDPRRVRRPEQCDFAEEALLEADKARAQARNKNNGPELKKFWRDLSKRLEARAKQLKALDVAAKYQAIVEGKEPPTDA
jgi:hypothetical protein